MPFVVYNTLTKTKETFTPREAGKVLMYNCGPTVYSRVHIGNFRAFLFADLLRRWLEYAGFEVRQVMNITDVGHLTDDGDQGDDKLEVQARKEKTDPRAIAEAHTAQFMVDLEDLGMLPAHHYPRASDHIPGMLAIIDDLLAKGHAYRVGENVYFDVTSFPAYGRLSGNKVEDLEAGARIEVHADKRHPADFALWKSDPHHLMKWESQFGAHGFPGWHIECSAMALEHLGPQIDIHTGGEDNVFPHHECEIAQSECHVEAPFSRYWMHTKFLQVDGGKMSKSLGNTYNLDDIRAQGFEPRHLRYALLRGHYRQPLNFTWEILGEARAAVEKLDDLAATLERMAGGQAAHADAAGGVELLDAARTKFEGAMNDDLNTPMALGALFELRAAALEKKLGVDVAQAAGAFLGDVFQVLGIARTAAGDEDTGWIDALVEARNSARANKQWAESDRIRDELLEKGIVIQDTPEGVVWRRK